jgi:hypothetical protein
MNEAHSRESRLPPREAACVENINNRRAHTRGKYIHFCREYVLSVGASDKRVTDGVTWKRFIGSPRLSAWTV